MAIGHSGPDSKLVALLSTEDVEYVLAWSLVQPVTELTQRVLPVVDELQSADTLEGPIGCGRVDPVGEKDRGFPSGGIAGAMTEELLSAGVN
jgi:hypothetical protein